MTLKEDFNELKRKTKEVETSFAVEILKDYKKANKRQFIIENLQEINNDKIQIFKTRKQLNIWYKNNFNKKMEY